jgi:hypothetical protein
MDTANSARDEALALGEKALHAILSGDSSGWAGLWGPHSALGLTEALYGAEGIRQLLDDGLEYDEFLLVGADSPPGHFLFEGLVLGVAGPVPFTTVQPQEPPFLLANLLRSGLALTSTMDHVDFLENLPHRPEPQLLLPARARLSAKELRLVEAFEDLPRGWRSAACALTVWRALRNRRPLGPRPEEDALLAAICYQTGPWRLMPLVNAAQWRGIFDVAEEPFVAAWQYLHRALDLEFDYFLYMPKLPESGVLPDPTSDTDLMSLVSGFLGTLEEDDEEGEEWIADDEEDDESGIFPLFPEGN